MRIISLKYTILFIFPLFSAYVVSPSQNPSVCYNMAAPGRHVGHYIQRNSRFLLHNVEQLWGHR